MAYQQHFKGTICIGNGNLTLQSLCTLYVNQAGHDKDIYLVHMTARIQQYLHYPGTDLLPIGTSLKTETLVFFYKTVNIAHHLCQGNRDKSIEINIVDNIAHSKNIRQQGHFELFHRCLTQGRVAPIYFQK